MGGGCQALALVALLGAGWHPASCNAQTAEATVPVVQDAQGVQVLTRGPVHEAFAGMVTYNPEPGIIVATAPPALIEEVPPGERPEGNNVTWIPGYWAWDEEPANFLWVSGTWRALPPGRQWMAGYWLETTQGYQWTSGYWADAAARETTYLAPPPATVEAGPNIAAPSADYRWTPGNWIWNQDRYAWGPGYWARGRADWDWTPSHYVWTPRGYIFVDGYWDYPIQRRGALFAPVYFDSGVYSHSGHYYTPSIAIDLAVFVEHLFLRPRYNHYYFGDYYAPSYQQGGYVSAYAYQSSSYGYDPIYSHQRWEHRQDRGWNDRMATAFQYRRDNESARPPHTWDAQRAIADTPAYEQNRMSVGAPLAQMAKRKDSGMRFQAVTKEEKQQLAQRGQEVGRFRDQRRTQETKALDPTTRKPGELMAPTRAEQARSPIVAKSANQLGKGRTPPAALRAPKLETAVQPTADPSGRQAREQNTDRLPNPRQPAATPREKQTLPAPRQPAATPREKQTQPASRQPSATPREKQSLPEPRQPAATPREKQSLPEPRKPAATPREKPTQPAPRQPAATPREKPAQPTPRQPAATPREKPAQPAPRQPAATPREKPAQPASRQPAATPRERPAQPAPRQPAATPRERPAQPAPRQPAATPRERPAQTAPSAPTAKPSAPRDATPGQPDKNDRKKNKK